MMSIYYANEMDEYLAHHGVLGMKWGKRNGPPYPLNASDHSASEKKAGWRKSLSGSDNKSGTTTKGRKKLSQTAKKRIKRAALAVGGAAAIAGTAYAAGKVGKKLSKFADQNFDVNQWLAERIEKEVKAKNPRYKKEKTKNDKVVDKAKKKLTPYVNYGKLAVMDAARVGLDKFGDLQQMRNNYKIDRIDEQIRRAENRLDRFASLNDSEGYNRTKKQLKNLEEKSWDLNLENMYLADQPTYRKRRREAAISKAIDKANKKVGIHTRRSGS